MPMRMERPGWRSCGSHKEENTAGLWLGTFADPSWRILHRGAQAKQGGGEGTGTLEGCLAQARPLAALRSFLEAEAQASAAAATTQEGLLALPEEAALRLQQRVHGAAMHAFGDAQVALWTTCPNPSTFRDGALLHY